MVGATLPVSMDDLELFPRKRTLNRHLNKAHVAVHRKRKGNGDASETSAEAAQASDVPKPDASQPSGVDEKAITEMRKELSSLWWSRLIIASRGYICSFYANEGDSEDTLFCFDDAFINLHKQFVERDPAMAGQCYQDLCILRTVSLDVLAELAAGYQVHEAEHPFHAQATRSTFARLFGKADAQTYYRAYKQSVAYNSFTDTLRTLAHRWATAASSNTLGKRGVRFVEDTEWQPDERVVVFQTFYTGNRTWVMMDFDRHILLYHRPDGVRTIFGDRYVQAKLDDGHKLCNYCGMIEQTPNQFVQCPQCALEKRDQTAAYCSAQCLRIDIDSHAKVCHS